METVVLIAHPSGLFLCFTARILELEDNLLKIGD